MSARGGTWSRTASAGDGCTASPSHRLRVSHSGAYGLERMERRRPGGEHGTPTLNEETAMTPETTNRTIVTGYDGSSAARSAVEYAIDRAGADGRVVLVHAYGVPADYVGASYYTAMVEDASQYAADLLDGLERDCALARDGRARARRLRRLRRVGDHPRRGRPRGRRDRHRQPRCRPRPRSAGQRRPRRPAPRAVPGDRDPGAHGRGGRDDTGRGDRRGLSVAGFPQCRCAELRSGSAGLSG